MKKVLFSLLLICFSTPYSFSQLNVTNNNTVDWYVQNVLLGAGVTVSNITYNAGPANIVNPQVGEFTDPIANVGLTNGMIIGSGDVTMAMQPNTGGGSTLGGTGASGSDPDLAAISTNSIFDECVIEFDFIPIGDTISFNYVFASEEYEEYVCSQFNDVFGFFLTGNNPAGGMYNSQNIALVPNPANPTTFTTTAVAINTINPGVAGANGNPSNCSAIDPNWASYNVFYQTNTGTAYEYDGRTVSLPVVVAVNCGETYHIKLAVGDAGDAAFDSGVFLEAGSFSSSGTVLAGAVAPGDIFMCTSNYTVNFDSGVNTPPNEYWDFGDGVGSSTQTDPTYTYADTGYYQVMYVAIDSASCNIADTVYFDVNLIQPDTFSAVLNVAPWNPCTGNDSLFVDLQFTGSGADSLIWDMGDGTLYYTDSITHWYTNPGTYIVTMTAFDTICGNSGVITDTVFYGATAVNINVSVSDLIACGGPPYIMNFNGDASAPNHYWDFGDGTGTSTQMNPNYTYADTGTYTIMYVGIDSSSCNIADTAYATVQIIQPDTISASLSVGPFDPCESDSVTVTLQFTGSGADSLVWDMGEGTIYINDTLVNHTYTSQGTYIITMTGWDVCGNVTVLTDTVNYNGVAFTVNVSVSDLLACSGPPYDVSLTGVAGIPDHYWDFGDGNNSTQMNPNHTYADTGTYNIMYVGIDSASCNIADTAYATIQIIQPEQFSATWNLTPPAPCEDTLIVDLAFTGTGADSIIWDMGDGTTFINMDSIYYVYTIPGTYTMSLTAYDSTCNNVETLSQAFTLQENLEIGTVGVPNVFTPNGDLANEKFRITYIDLPGVNPLPNLDFYSCRVYNRWGRLVFESGSSINDWEWDGKINGDNAAEGVYYYVIEYQHTCTETEKTQVTGHVSIMR